MLDRASADVRRYVMRKSYLPLSSDAKCGEYSGTITSQMEFPAGGDVAIRPLFRRNSVCLPEKKSNVFLLCIMIIFICIIMYTYIKTSPSE